MRLPPGCAARWIVNRSHGWYERWASRRRVVLKRRRLSAVGAGWELSLDVIVTPSEDRKAWNLADLLGRSMGSVEATSESEFIIHPDGYALETMAGIEQGPHASLDAALAEIEKHTRGLCRRNPGEDSL